MTAARSSWPTDPPAHRVPSSRPALVAVPDRETLRGRADALRQRRAALAGVPDAQHSRGKLTVRERLDLLFDAGTFVELQSMRRHRASGFGLDDRRPDGDGVVTGWGLVDGRRVFVYAHDFRVFGGSLGEAHAAKIHQVMDRALAAGSPLVGLCDGAGARIQEGVVALAGYGGIFRRHVAASGVIPQISVVLGPCAGGAAYSPALTDFVVMTRDTAQLYVTGPDVVAQVTGEQVDHAGLGGAEVHATRSGLATAVHDDEQGCLEDVRRLLSYLPDNNRGEPAVDDVGDPGDREVPELVDLVPLDAMQAYDVRTLLEIVADADSVLEVQADFAANVVCAFARLDGHAVGIVASQPHHLAGTLDIDASDKAARFVSTCDAFNLPIITVVDVPGFLPGTEQEHRGLIRHGAKLVYAYSAATVPRIQLIVRKAYGGAYIVMDSPGVGTDLSLAWPSNEVAVMGAEGAAAVVFRKQIAAADDPHRARADHIDRYRRELMHPYYAVERGLVDELVDPADTRRALVEGLAMLRGKHATVPARKHGNPPV